MESSWYQARFASPDANRPMVDERAKYWTPVDHYVGGIEHAILHLLYARFYHKLMRDEGLLDSDEPWKRLLMLGMVLKDGKKMSKSAGDAGNPQHLLDKYGADAVRTAMMFAAPPDQSFEWSEAGVEGQGRFMKRLWKQVWDHLDAGSGFAGGTVPTLDVDALSAAGRDLRRKTHETLKRADDDYGRRLSLQHGGLEPCMSLSIRCRRWKRRKMRIGRRCTKRCRPPCWCCRPSPRTCDPVAVDGARW